MKNRYLYFLALVIIVLVCSCTKEENKLFDAIKEGDLDKVQSLVESGVSVMSCNSNGLSALEIARLNNQTEIAEYLYEETKKILDRETDLLLKVKYSKDLSALKKLNADRLKYLEKFNESDAKINSMISEDKRISDDLLAEHEKFFKINQKITKDFINNKVELMENILDEFIDRDFITTIESKDTRKIVNLNIMEKLRESD
ncbi:MAG TPA: ankyrin repeat domain-containing protein [Clostridiales bacterium]|jgi:hypothetical protein|nr:ankyrin repeat domain-containing protein [Clostridiales bacterium]HQP69403.1 ankyrin repeat domain-containing protein [Clostridiales bacterium]